MKSTVLKWTETEAWLWRAQLLFVVVGCFFATSQAWANGPNQPAGMTVKMNEAWNAVPPSAYPGDNAGWWCDSGDCSPYSIISDGTAPRSGPNVLRLTFQGNIGGGSPAHSYYGYPSALMPNNGLIYQRLSMRVSPNWTDAGNVGTKFFFPRANAANENSYIGLSNFGTVRLHWSENGAGWNSSDYYPMSLLLLGCVA